MKQVLTKEEKELLRYCKSNKPTIQGLVEIYARRCAIDVEYAQTQLDSLAAWLMDIVENYGNPRETNLFEFMKDLHPAKNQSWYFGFEGGNSYYENWIRVLGSRIRMMEVKQLPEF